MAVDVSKSNKMLVTTDFPLDKVVVGGTAHFTVPAATTGVGSLFHGLPYAPLMMGSYSLTSDYAILYGLNSAPISSIPTIRQYDYVLKINSDNDEIFFSGENYTASPITFYVRYYGLEPSPNNDASGATRSIVDPLQLSSDYNYTKLFMAGYRDYPTSGSPTSGTTTIPHGLGKIPQVLAWRETNGLCAPLMIHDDGVFQIENSIVSVNEQDLMIKMSLPASQPPYRVHYRVYLDD